MRAADARSIGGVAARARLDQQPGLVERAAGNAKAAAPQIGETADRREGRDHDPAGGTGERREAQPVAGGALHRDERPVGNHDVSAAREQCHAPGISVGEQRGAQREAVRGIEPVAADHLGDPLHGAELQHAEPHDGRRGRRGAENDAGERGKEAGAPADRGRADAGRAGQVVAAPGVRHRRHSVAPGRQWQGGFHDLGARRYHEKIGSQRSMKTLLAGLLALPAIAYAAGTTTTTRPRRGLTTCSPA